MTQVNRYLTDKAMDRIDHALGRPLDPMTETYRNHFAIDTDDSEAKEMRNSSHWKERRTLDGMTCFTVTDEGRRSLANHLKAINDPHRAYVISFGAYTRTVISTSPAKARYSYFLDLEIDGLTFGAFIQECRTKMAVKSSLIT